MKHQLLLELDKMAREMQGIHFLGEIYSCLPVHAAAIATGPSAVNLLKKFSISENNTWFCLILVSQLRI